MLTIVRLMIWRRSLKKYLVPISGNPFLPFCLYFSPFLSCFLLGWHEIQECFVFFISLFMSKRNTQVNGKTRNCKYKFKWIKIPLHVHNFKDKTKNEFWIFFINNLNCIGHWIHNFLFKKSIGIKSYIKIINYIIYFIHTVAT